MAEATNSRIIKTNGRGQAAAPTLSDIKMSVQVKNDAKHGECHRKNIRLRDYDYSQNGAYFVTICTQDKRCLFGKSVNGEMILNGFGKVVEQFWREIGNRFRNVIFDEFIVMPNHIHGIVIIAKDYSLNSVGATLAVAHFDNQNQRAGASPAPTLSDIVGAHKSIVANLILRKMKSENKQMGRLWQRNYYEHIIRNEDDLFEIRQYIVNNPLKWEVDKYHAC